MKLYHHQIETINTLKAGRNVVRAGSRRVGLTTAALLYIKWKLDHAPFCALLHTRNPQKIFRMVTDHNLPYVEGWFTPSESHTIIKIANNTELSCTHFDLYDDVSPHGRIPNQWALIATEGMCNFDGCIGAFEHMEYVSYKELEIAELKL